MSNLSGLCNLTQLSVMNNPCVMMTNQNLYPFFFVALNLHFPCNAVTILDLSLDFFCSEDSITGLTSSIGASLWNISMDMLSEIRKGRNGLFLSQ